MKPMRLVMNMRFMNRTTFTSSTLKNIKITKISRSFRLKNIQIDPVQHHPVLYKNSFSINAVNQLLIKSSKSTFDGYIRLMCLQSGEELCTLIFTVNSHDVNKKIKMGDMNWLNFAICALQFLSSTCLLFD